MKRWITFISYSLRGVSNTQVGLHFSFLLTFCMLGNFSCFYYQLLNFFQNDFPLFKKFFQEQYQSQTVWIQIRTDILSVLIWVQTVCIGYQHMTKVTANKVRVDTESFSPNIFNVMIGILQALLSFAFFF